MNLCNINDIKSLLGRHDFHFSKSMGQNFLIEDWIPKQIAETSGADKYSGVIEIGPGIGTLTQQLASRASKVISIELDKKLYPILSETMACFPNFSLVPGDAMKIDFKEIVSTEFTGLKPILCANLPYNITTPILTKIIECNCFNSFTVLIQKEVAERICAAPGTSEYGAFTILMQYYTIPELVFTVPNTAFIPAPKVTSAVLHCQTRKEPPVETIDTEWFWKTVRAAFSLRRKTLANSLQNGLGISKDIITDSIRKCGFNDTIRGERLSIEDFATLADELYNRTH